VTKYVIAIAALVVVVVAGVVFYERYGTPTTQVAATAESAAAVTDAEPPALYPDDMILGDPDAPVTIIEYASLSCPHCADFQTEVLPQLKTAYIDTGKAKLVYRDFPLNQPALHGAQLAHCVAPQSYFGMLELLFRNQDKWAFGTKVDEELTRLGATAGIDATKFKACLEDEAMRERIVNRALEAEQKFGVNSTPTFIVNGTKLTGTHAFEDFQKAIDAAQP